MGLASSRLTESRKGISGAGLFLISVALCIVISLSVAAYSPLWLLELYSSHGSSWVATFTAAHPFRRVTVVLVAAVGPKMNHDTTVINNKS